MEDCPACNRPIEEHSKIMMIECIEKFLEEWDDAVKKLPHNLECD